MESAAPARVLRRKRLFVACCCVVILILFAVAGFLRRPITFQRLHARARFALAGAHDSIAQAGPYRVHYYVAGSGRPIVLLHGLGGDALFWSSYLPDLAEQGRVYAIDLIGFGSSDRPDVDYGAAFEAQVVRDFLDSQNLRQVDLVGFSLGGLVALHVARLWPERVRRLVIADAAGIAFQPNEPQPSFPQDAETFQHLMSPKRMPAFVARDIVQRIHAQQPVIDRFLQNRDNGKDAVDGHLNAVDMPVLVLWGEQDLLTPVSWGHLLRRQIPRSELLVLRGCGHIALYDCRLQALPEIRRFLSIPEPRTGGVRTMAPE